MSAESVSRRLRTTDLAYIAPILGFDCRVRVDLHSRPRSLHTANLRDFRSTDHTGRAPGLYAVAVYLLLGLAGLPVFAGFQGGAGTLPGVTGGYILGFGASALVYWLVTTRLGTALPVSILACVLGLVVCYAFGTAWFWWLTPVPPVLSVLRQPWVCVLPFVVPDLIKLALAALLSRRVGKFLR